VVHAARATSFGEVAGVYERARPGYPAAVVGWLLGERPVQVADVGAGTGKLTRVLLDAGHEVTAVEPSPQMLAELLAAVPGVRGVLGRGEALPLPDASVDAVTYAQAWHWVDPLAASLEAARVLRPGGVLGLAWNLRRSDNPLGAGLQELIGDEDRHAPDRGDELVTVGPQFGSIERASFPHGQPRTRDELLGLVASRSYVVLMDPDARAALLERVGALHDRVAVDGTTTLAYETAVYRARLVG
jgi:ubiquinone/menaquinone biosynthesis C-methylase UbiE